MEIIRADMLRCAVPLITYRGEGIPATFIKKRFVSDDVIIGSAAPEVNQIRPTGFDTGFSAGMSATLYFIS